MNHADARTYTNRGFKLTFGREPTLPESQIAQGVGWLETQYGQGWKGAGVGSNNMGAIQSGKPPCTPGKSFLYTDTNPTSSGASIPYSICFKWYPDAAAGFGDLIRVAYKINGRQTVLDAAHAGDIYGASEALYLTNYYKGFGPTREVRIAHHYRALRSAVNRRAAALGEKMPNGNDPLVRVLKFSFPFIQRGDDVRRVQRVVGVGDDGWYGTETRRAVRGLQTATPGLEPDGVVGLDTWDVIQELEKT
jgi:hypothetical protein